MATMSIFGFAELAGVSSSPVSTAQCRLQVDQFLEPLAFKTREDSVFVADHETGFPLSIQGVPCQKKRFFNGLPTARFPFRILV